VNTQYLSFETMNPTSTSTIQAIVATATAAANGQSLGDISLILPEGLATELLDFITTGTQQCGVAAKVRRRDDKFNDEGKTISF
jgi:hypothetical protein